jgi:hypothetical protein
LQNIVFVSKLDSHYKAYLEKDGRLTLNELLHISKNSTEYSSTSGIWLEQQ